MPVDILVSKFCFIHKAEMRELSDIRPQEECNKTVEEMYNGQELCEVGHLKVICCVVGTEGDVPSLMKTLQV